MKYLQLLGLFMFCFTSCTDQLVTDKEGEPCLAIACTQEFRSITVTFKNKSGQPITVKNFIASIRRTGKSTQSGAAEPINFNGSYNVVTDNDTKNLISSGDTIDVSAVNPQTNQKKTAQFIVSGGKCACHIEKISGPEEIIFD